MPTRNEKQIAGRSWRLWFLPTSSAKAAADRLVKGVLRQEKERNKVKIVFHEGKQILLEWDRPIKYDAARQAIMRLGSVKGDQFRVDYEPPTDPVLASEVCSDALSETGTTHVEVGTPDSLLILKFLSASTVSPPSSAAVVAVASAGAASLVR